MRVRNFFSGAAGLPEGALQQVRAQRRPWRVRGYGCNAMRLHGAQGRVDSKRDFERGHG